MRVVLPEKSAFGGECGVLFTVRGGKYSIIGRGEGDSEAS